MKNLPKVVVLGGGTGLSRLLSGLKHFPLDITAIVTVADDGGSTGKLRREFSIPAIGDLRNVLVSLSNVEPLVQQLLQYRFKTNSDLNGHPTGNLLLTAMLDITGNLVDAVDSLGKVFNVKGTILPSTEEQVTLVAHMTDGTIVEGESNIAKARKKIDYISYKKEPKTVGRAIDAIMEADVIILGIGSLYTSIIPTFIATDMKKALLSSRAHKMYVCNVMTEPGETDGYTVKDFIDALYKHMGAPFLDSVVVNIGPIPPKILKKYQKEGSNVVLITKELEGMPIEIIKGDFIEIEEDGYIRHNPLKLAATIYTHIIG